MNTDFFVVEEDGAGERLDQYLSRIYAAEGARCRLSRSAIQKLIDESRVKIDGEPVKKSRLLREDDEISVEIPDAAAPVVEPEDIPLDILYEDEDILVVNKPKHMVVHPSAGHLNHTLVNAVLYHCRDSLSGINGVLRPGIVHRIDQDTTGSIIVCKNDLAHTSIAEQIKAHSCERVYEGIVTGDIREERGEVESYIGRDPKNRKRMASVAMEQGKYAKTHYEVKEHFRGYAFVQFRLETGRTHQIRVHMAGMGHPLLGDTLYSSGKSPFRTEGQCLHAKHIAFEHPRDHRRIEVDAPTPAYMERILQSLRGQG